MILSLYDICVAMKLMIKLNMQFSLEKCMSYVEYHLVDFVLGYVAMYILSAINNYFIIILFSFFRLIHHHILMLLTNVLELETHSMQMILA